MVVFPGNFLFFTIPLWLIVIIYSGSINLITSETSMIRFFSVFIFYHKSSPLVSKCCWIFLRILDSLPLNPHFLCCRSFLSEILCFHSKICFLSVFSSSSFPLALISVQDIYDLSPWQSYILCISLGFNNSRLSSWLRFLLLIRSSKPCF